MSLNRPQNSKCSVEELEHRHEAILGAGLRLGDDTPFYVTWYASGTIPHGVYLNKHTASIRLVVHPDDARRAAVAAGRTGAVFAPGPYHNANMSRFPKRRNDGADPIHYGHKVVCDSTARLTAFLQALAA